MEELAKVGEVGITFGAVFAAVVVLALIFAPFVQSSRISRREEKWYENK